MAPLHTSNWETKQQLRADTHTAYIRNAPQAYQDLNIRPHTKSSRAQEHKLPHWVLGWLIAARTRQGDFAEFPPHKLLSNLLLQ